MNSKTIVWCLIVVGLALPTRVHAATPQPFEPAAVEFFEKKIRPLLIDNCYECHSANTNSKGGLRVDDRNGLLAGGQSGAAIAPGQPAESLLLKAVSRTHDDLKMPPNKELSAEQVADLTKWIQDGAAWPQAEIPSDLGQPNPEYEALRKEHWAWQPLRHTTPPAVKNLTWARSDVDLYLQSKLEERGLQPVGDADKLTLIRRLTFDLTGLPPTPAEIDSFLADGSDDALEKVVDRLLALPAFGERWGRHWLDVARFGESTGSSRNLPYPHAWRYREYVIAALNKDKPYDQFIREQIAGDLLPADTQEQRDEQRVATGFLALGVKDVNQRFKVRFIMDNIDEQIDTVSRSVLALTASCARCHDHKFDPIPTADYYALAGIFHSTDLCAGVRNKMGGGGLDYYDTDMLLALGGGNQSFEKSPADAQKAEELKKAIAEARTEFQSLRGKPEGNEPGPDGRPKRAIARQKMTKLQAELMELNDPLAHGGQAAVGVREGKTIADTEIRLRGEAEQLGPSVPRGFLGVLQVPDAPQINSAQSGRLELAHWLTSKHNPLTPRVMVNRVWQHLFGQGLVTSVDNFGLNGDKPSHPELLDHLANQFVQDGWSTKKLVRSLILTRAYRLCADAPEAQRAADPGNQLVWRHSPRRLQAEELRDAALLAAGNLNRALPGASPAQGLRVVELRNNGPESRQLAALAAADTHRSVYLPLLRGLVPRSLEVFDFAEQGMVTGRRDTTTVATQALYQLNNPFVRKQSLLLAEQLLAQASSDDTERINRAYRLTLSRTATLAEIERALRFLADYETTSGPLLAATPTSAPADAPSVNAVATTDAGASAAVSVTATDAAASNAAAAETAEAKPAKKKPPANPDEADQTDEPVNEEVIQPSSPRAAAWASFCQALLGSAEFRYLK